MTERAQVLVFVALVIGIPLGVAGTLVYVIWQLIKTNKRY